jgi:hypothetical protein
MVEEDGETTIDGAEDVLDMESIESDIAAGVKAFSKLLKRSAEDWMSWSITIRGLRALRNLAFANSHTSDLSSWHYRQALGDLLEQKKYSVYSHIDKQTRSTCYKLMDGIEEVDAWYATLPAADQLRWKHPDAIAKHCPKHLLAGGKGHNKPKKIDQKKRASSAEEDRLRQILIVIINGFVVPVNPQRAAELLKQIYPEGDPNDSLVGALDAAEDDASGFAMLDDRDKFDDAREAPEDES